jgi:hypothetical protein
MSFFAPCARIFALETRQYETRQVLFGVRSVVVDLLPTTLRLVTPIAPAGAPVTTRHSQMSAIIGDVNPLCHDKSLFRSGRSGIGPGEGQITGAHTRRKIGKTQLCAPAGLDRLVVQLDAEISALHSASHNERRRPILLCRVAEIRCL